MAQGIYRAAMLDAEAALASLRPGRSVVRVSKTTRSAAFWECMAAMESSRLSHSSMAGLLRKGCSQKKTLWN